MLANVAVEVMSLDYSLGGGNTTDEILYWLKDHPDRWPDEVLAHSGSYDGRRLIEELVREFRPTREDQ